MTFLSFRLQWLLSLPNGISWLFLVLTLVAAIILTPHITTIRTFITGSALPAIPRLKSRNPFLGSLPKLCTDGLPEFLQKLLAKSGDDGLAYCWVGPVVLVAMSEPLIIRQVLSQSDDICSREGKYNVRNPFLTMRRLVGNTLLVDVGQTAKARRALVHSTFNHSKALAENFDFISGMAKKHVNIAVEQDTGSDLKRVLCDFAVDLFGEFIYDMPNTHLENNTLIPLSATISSFMADASHTWRHGLRSLLSFRGFAQCDRVEQRTRETFLGIHEKRVEFSHTREMKAKYLTKGTLRKLTMASGGSSQGPYSATAHELAQLNLYGGHYSIGNITTWALFELSRSPAMYQKLKTELEALGSPENLTYQKVQKGTPFLDAIISETMRLYPVGHATARIVNQPFDITTASGKCATMRPGMLLYISFYHLFTSRTLWGPDAMKFNPERWMEKNFRAKVNHFFLPFGYGPRGCVGYQFAMLGLKMYMIQLLSQHDIIIEERTQWLKWGAILEPGKPLKFRVINGTGAI